MNLIVTSLGRPLGRIPLIKWRDGSRYLLILGRVDVSDARNTVTPFYQEFIALNRDPGMTSLDFHFPKSIWTISLTKRRIKLYVTRQTD